MRIPGGLAAALLALPSLSFAAGDEARPAYVPPPAAVSSGSVLQVIFSLLLVLAVIVLVAWLLRRANMLQQGPASRLKVLGAISVGQRERVVLVELEDTWLVIGVGPGQIRTLHTLPRPLDADTRSNAQATPEMKARFAAILGGVLSGKRNNA